MNSYEENEMRRLCALRKTGARLFALAPSIKRNVLRCAAGKATLMKTMVHYLYLVESFELILPFLLLLSVGRRSGRRHFGGGGLLFPPRPGHCRFALWPKRLWNLVGTTLHPSELPCSSHHRRDRHCCLLLGHPSHDHDLPCKPYPLDLLHRQPRPHSLVGFGHQL